MSIPPLLRSHVDDLKQKWPDIVIKKGEGSELGVIIKNYNVPDDIWKPKTTNLLVIAHNSYPNAAMDMFWVSPSLSLRNKHQPQGVSEAIKFNQRWQQFSWHTDMKLWNPGIDSIKTHLAVVEKRLRMAE